MSLTRGQSRPAASCGTNPHPPAEVLHSPRTIGRRILRESTGHLPQPVIADVPQEPTHATSRSTPPPERLLASLGASGLSLTTVATAFLFVLGTCYWSGYFHAFHISLFSVGISFQRTITPSIYTVLMLFEAAIVYLAWRRHWDLDNEYDDENAITALQSRVQAQLTASGYHVEQSDIAKCLLLLPPHLRPRIRAAHYPRGVESALYIGFPLLTGVVLWWCNEHQQPMVIAALVWGYVLGALLHAAVYRFRITHVRAKVGLGVLAASCLFSVAAGEYDASRPLDQVSLTLDDDATPSVFGLVYEDLDGVYVCVGIGPIEKDGTHTMGAVQFIPARRITSKTFQAFRLASVSK